MLRAFIVAFAYVGIVVGAGFASGRESLQFYTSFGLKGTLGIALAFPLYAYFGMMLVKIGHRLKSTNHNDTIRIMIGSKLGRVIDYVIIFTMIVTGIGMIAGGGSLLQQQFGLPLAYGNLIMTIMVTITLMLHLEKIVIAIGFLTPVLLVITAIVCIYSIAENTQSFASLEPMVMATKSTMPDTLPNWFISSINHASFNITVGVGMALAMGGNEKNESSAIWGGILGGIIIAALLTLAHFALFAQIESIGSYVDGKLKIADLPLLAIANKFSPMLGVLMSVVIFGMVYNTAVSMFYVFVTRFSIISTQKGRLWIIGTMIVAYIVSFIGFTDLVGIFYPLIGYAGLVLIAMLIYAPFRLKKLQAKTEVENT